MNYMTYAYVDEVYRQGEWIDVYSWAICKDGKEVAGGETVVRYAVVSRAIQNALRNIRINKAERK